MQFEDERGNEFEYEIVDGGAVIGRCRARSAEVRIPALLGQAPVLVIGPEAFASARSMSPGELPSAAGNRLRFQEYLDARRGGANCQLERVVLPQGVKAIGRAAFRGCSRLRQVELPESLERIDDLAFSCTDLRGVRIPTRCVQLSDQALRTGPEAIGGANTCYRSKLEAIQVDVENPRYLMRGPVLCQRVEGGLETLLCPGAVDEVDLSGGDVVRVAPTSFAGTFDLGHLIIDESLECDDSLGLVPTGACECLTVVSDPDAGKAVDIRLAAALPRQDLFAVACEHGRFDLQRFLDAYDGALLELEDRFDRAQLMLARLADPYGLAEARRERFASELERSFDPLCAHFGARGMWAGFDMLADAGLLLARNITHAIDVLSKVSDAAAIGYLLQMKRERFTEKAWDYGI